MSADTQHDPPEAARKSSQRLNPCDYFMLVLDHVVRGQGLPGNVTVFRIDVAGAVDVDRLAMAIGRLHGRHPLLGARLEKRWPWRYRWVDVRFPPDFGVPVISADGKARTGRVRSVRGTQSEPGCPQPGLRQRRRATDNVRLSVRGCPTLERSVYRPGT